MKQPLSRKISSILNYYQMVWLKKAVKKTGPRIRVSETLSSVASFYERVRYTIDYKKEHLLRRNAIERILKRTVSAETLIKELIWAKYIKNNFYPESKIGEVQTIIAKYLFLSQKLTGEWHDWLFSIASCEIEENLEPKLESIDVLATAISVWFEEKFTWQESGLTEAERENQLAIAVHRGLLRSDEAKNAYFLLKRMFRGWQDETAETLADKSDQASQIFSQIRQSLANPVQARLYRFVQREVVAFQILKTLIEQDPVSAEKVISDPEILSQAVGEICEEKYSEIRSRVNRGISRSIIYIFVTKVLFAIAIEIPYEFYFFGRISGFPLLTTIAVPLFFVFLVGITLKRPGEANTQKIIEIVFDFIYPDQKEKTVFSLKPKTKGFRQQVFETIYWTLFFGVFALVTFILKQVGFNFVGIAVFFIFLSLVMLFGYRVKFTAAELNVAPIKENLASNLLSNLTLPFLDLGVWLADKFAQLNFLVVLFDFLVEAPFKNIIGVIDEWINYLREKKEEAIEVPVER